MFIHARLARLVNVLRTSLRWRRALALAIKGETLTAQNATLKILQWNITRRIFYGHYGEYFAVRSEKQANCKARKFSMKALRGLLRFFSVIILGKRAKQGPCQQQPVLWSNSEALDRRFSPRRSYKIILCLIEYGYVTTPSRALKELLQTFVGRELCWSRQRLLTFTTLFVHSFGHDLLIIY